jgi:hypothetical protein
VLLLRSTHTPPSILLHIHYANMAALAQRTSSTSAGLSGRYKSTTCAVAAPHVACTHVLLTAICSASSITGRRAVPKVAGARHVMRVAASRARSGLQVRATAAPAKDTVNTSMTPKSLGYTMPGGCWESQGSKRVVHGIRGWIQQLEQQDMHCQACPAEGPSCPPCWHSTTCACLCLYSSYIC